MSDLDTKLKEHFQRFLKENLPDYSDPNNGMTDAERSAAYEKANPPNLGPFDPLTDKESADIEKDIQKFKDDQSSKQAAKSPQQQKADYDENYADEIGLIVGDDKYTEEDVLKWVGSFEGDSFDDLYDKAPTVKNYSYDEDGEEVEDDEVYYKTSDEASKFWNKQIDDYFNNSDTKLKEHFQRFLKDYQ